jgi:hypothetical protein
LIAESEVVRLLWCGESALVCGEMILVRKDSSALVERVIWCGELSECSCGESTGVERVRGWRGCSGEEKCSGVERVLCMVWRGCSGVERVLW